MCALLYAYRDHCNQCCHRDESGYTVKRYAQARLEVCTCKFGAYPQIQGRYWYLSACNEKRWMDGHRYLTVLHKFEWLFITECHETMLHLVKLRTLKSSWSWHVSWLSWHLPGGKLGKSSVRVVSTLAEIQIRCRPKRSQLRNVESYTELFSHLSLANLCSYSLQPPFK